MQHVVKAAIQRYALGRLKQLLLAMIANDQHPVRAVQAVRRITVCTGVKQALTLNHPGSQHLVMGLNVFFT